jgi:hypothetical protein
MSAPDLTVFDLTAAPAEKKKLSTSANARFYLSCPRPGGETTGSVGDHIAMRNGSSSIAAADVDDGDESVALTARELLAVAVYVKEVTLTAASHRFSRELFRH